MHSSRMRTAHALTLFPGGGWRGCGVCSGVGVPSLPREGVGGPPLGPLLRVGGDLGGGGGGTVVHLWGVGGRPLGPLLGVVRL